MDSVSQAVPGAAVAVAVMQRRNAVWKATAWGAVAGTLPDLGVLLDHGDPILNRVLHRAGTHSLVWLSLHSLPPSWAVARLHGQADLWRRWWLALRLVLVTHPLLDTMALYGTQGLLPFPKHSFGVGSTFVFDPLYKLPMLVGGGAYREGFHSLFDDEPQSTFAASNVAKTCWPKFSMRRASSASAASVKASTCCKTNRAGFALLTCARASTRASALPSMPPSVSAGRPRWPFCLPLQQASHPTWRWACSG